ncbi:protein of unknown function [Pedobacter terrae]|uniref:DUF4468 domain-containing protein n=1 Tax=Pedobacter terrae TaxID=405671 RepID=A0A1G7T9X1_9SPHI|nr:DUF4468 domain-containing protein [Pedobacter terrae]SDG32123.1 protein of unknown function [Pedobacter terrae]
MKKLTLFLISIPFLSFSQTFKSDDSIESAYKDQPAHTLDTVVISSLTKQQLYSNTLNYLTTSFKDSRSVVEMKDSDLGEVSFNGVIESDITNLYFKCKVYNKDNKFKVVLSALEYSKPIEGLNLSKRQLRIANKNFDPEQNKVARQIATSLIKDIAYRINKKPENDF